MIAGVDEVGRGPLAGAVIAAAVILDEPIEGARDSKALSEKKRKLLEAEIKSRARAYAYGRVEAEEIDTLNIHAASLLAMQRAVLNLPVVPDQVLVDGKFCPDLSMDTRAIIGGDSTVLAISCASILAKVMRDEEMIRLDGVYPGYGFAKHKGYPTKVHQAALKTLGPCEIHRKSFGPVARVLRSS